MSEEYRQKNILAIETSTAYLKLAISFGGDRLVKSVALVEQSHGRFLIKKIGELCQSSGLGIGQIDAIIASIGPGSFTGLRIGLAAAKGIAVANDIPVIGVSLFEIAAARLKDIVDGVDVIIPLTRDQYFVARIDSEQFEIDSIRVLSGGDIAANPSNAPIIGIGADMMTHFPDHPNILEPGEISYHAADLLYVGLEKLLAGQVDDLEQLEPLYIQKSQAEIRFEQRQSEQGT